MIFVGGINFVLGVASDATEAPPATAGRGLRPVTDDPHQARAWQFRKDSPRMGSRPLGTESRNRDPELHRS